MFWKRRKTPVEQVQDDSQEAIAALKPKWRIFCETLPFRSDVPLADRIEAFASPAFVGMVQHYPSLKHAPPGLLWMILFTAILEAKTHPTDEVNLAIAALEKRFTR